MINWFEEAEKYREALIRDLKGLIAIPSLRCDEERREGAPFGEGPRQALDYMLELGSASGFDTRTQRAMPALSPWAKASRA